MHISFGTEGWRAIVGDLFTFENIRKLARGVANWLYWPERSGLDIYKRGYVNNRKVSCIADGGVAIGYDTRFMSEDFARAAAEEFSRCGIPVFLSSSFAPTPIISNIVEKNHLSAGIVITASHNTANYNGVKYKGEYGGSATPEIVWGIEKMIETKKQYFPAVENKAPIVTISPMDEYVKHISELVDMERIANSRFKIISDPIYGSAIGLFDKIFHSVGVFVEEIRNERNPLFGGYTPEPAVKNIAPLMEKVLRTKANIGFAFDGDADTIGVVGSRGSFLQNYDVFSIILWHLVENRKMSGEVAATFSTSRLIKTMAERYGFPFHETPVGFRHLTNLFLQRDLLIGGEESGGLGIKGSIPDKNGPLAALLLLEAMAWSGKGIDDIKDEIIEKFGAYYLHRTDIKFNTNDEKDEVISKLCHNIPSSFGDEKISDVYTLDGIKYILEDHSWVLFRPSGTEPVFRIYAESSSHQKSYKILAECEELIAKITKK